ncbi:MAG: MmgE/PrpD family protein, partial [Candidatus Dormibacteraceae bacterium]
MPEPVEATAMLSRFCSGLSLADLPAEVLDRVRWLLLDSIGCAFGGTVSEFGAVAQGLVDLVGGGAEATVLGSGQQTSAPGAAAANARLAGALDGDETFPSAGQTSHHAVSAVFAALALCERSAASGAELVSAIAAGYELGARFGIAVGATRPQPGRESTTWRVGGGPAGVLSATTASARALGLDATA